MIPHMIDAPMHDKSGHDKSGHDKFGRDEQDRLLMRLFAEQAQSLPATGFMVQLVTRLEREQQRRRAYSAVAIVAMLVVGVLTAPWVTQVLVVLENLAVAATGALGSALLSPIAWVACGAVLFALLPVFYVWRPWRS